MELLPLAFVSGWACGVNAWATLLVLGLLGRFAAFAEIPDALQRTDVLIVVGLLTVLELLVDKVVHLDSAWNVIGTVVRPIAGGAVGALLAGADGGLPAVLLAAIGGVTALLSHLAHSVLRLAINTTGESASTIGASVAGDLAVAFAVVGAVVLPVLTAIVALLVLVVLLLAAIRLRGRARIGWRGLSRPLTDRLVVIRRAVTDRRHRGRTGDRN